MPSVFQKFGGIRPMSAKTGDPSSTVKSWHKKGKIPGWRHNSILEAASKYGIDVSRDEVENVRPDDPEFQPTRAKRHAVSTERCAS